MNRTDRLYALVEELRAVAPRPRSASWLAARFEVTARTVERDILALQESGVPIWAQPGRAGGYTLDRERTLPPLTLTPEEALAIAVALRAAGDSPFAEAARSASLKVLAALPADIRRTEGTLAAHVHRVGEESARPVARDELLSAIAGRRVVRLGYVDASGAATERDVEPLGLLWGPTGWYLLGCCRLRDGVRGFLLGRMTACELLDEVAPPRDADVARELDRLDARPLRD